MNDIKVDNGKKYNTHLNNVIMIGFRDGHKITGKLINVGEDYLVLQHLDKRKSTVNFDQVSYIIEVRRRSQ